MKNLANCKPSEFLRQTNRIRKVAEKWLTSTNILNIRKTQPILEGKTQEEKDAAIKAQVKANLNKMLDAILEDNSEETLELLALACFIEPAEIDNYKVSDILLSIAELLNDQAVLSFFTSLVKLGQSGILN